MKTLGVPLLILAGFVALYATLMLVRWSIREAKPWLEDNSLDQTTTVEAIRTATDPAVALFLSLISTAAVAFVMIRRR